jgi:hypothetical protein
MDTNHENENFGKCKELGITKCGSKIKPQLAELINSRTLEISTAPTQNTALTAPNPKTRPSQILFNELFQKKPL